MTNPKGERADDHAARGARRLDHWTSATTPGCRRTASKPTSRSCCAVSPHAIEDGLRLVRREYPTAIGPIDLVCRDADGHVVAIEVKRRGEIDGVEQLARYIERLHLDSSLGDGPRRVRRPGRSSPRPRCWPRRAASAGSRSTTTSSAAWRPTTCACSDAATFPAMPQQVQWSVARAKGEPVSIETIVVPDPGPGEAVVQIQACGVCHTDLHYREGGDQRRVPVPARPRGGRHRRVGRRRASPTSRPATT